MTVTLNIQNDEELRAYCKQMVFEQVNGLTRQELKLHITEEFDRKVKALTERNFNVMLKDAFKSAIKELLIEGKVMRDSWNGHQMVKDAVKIIVDEYIEGVGREKLVYQIAKQLTTPNA